MSFDNRPRNERNDDPYMSHENYSYQTVKDVTEQLEKGSVPQAFVDMLHEMKDPASRAKFLVDVYHQDLVDRSNRRTQSLLHIDIQDESLTVRREKFRSDNNALQNFFASFDWSNTQTLYKQTFNPISGQIIKENVNSQVEK